MRVATDLESDVGEFRLMSREVVEALAPLRERHRLIRGLVSWVGFRQTTLPFERPGRVAGLTKFPLRRMLELSLDGITSFSAAPLRVATALGVLAILLGAGYAGYAIWIGYVRGLGVPGWTSLVILNVFFSGIVLVCLGLVGEYVGRIFEEVKHRPLYVVRRRVGVRPTSPPDPSP
jgi:dolichol-phosphate mannosyltransferase